MLTLSILGMVVLMFEWMNTVTNHTDPGWTRSSPEDKFQSVMAFGVILNLVFWGGFFVLVIGIVKMATAGKSSTSNATQSLKEEVRELREEVERLKKLE